MLTVAHCAQIMKTNSFIQIPWETNQCSFHWPWRYMTLQCLLVLESNACRMESYYFFAHLTFTLNLNLKWFHQNSDILLYFISKEYFGSFMSLRLKVVSTQVVSILNQSIFEVDSASFKIISCTYWVYKVSYITTNTKE